jgi:2'-5' RNA ligase
VSARADRIQFEELRRRYEMLDERGQEAIRDGHVQPDIAPHDHSPRWGLSVVALIGDHTAEALAAAARECAEALTSADIVHDRTTLHTTVRTLEHHRASVPPDDPLVAQYAEALDAVCAATPPFEIRFEGVVLTPGGVLAAGYPRDRTLTRLRAQLYQELDRRSLAGSPERARSRTTAHASLAVFMSDGVDCHKLLDWHAKYRHVPFARCEVDRLTLVQSLFQPSFAIVSHHEAALEGRPRP